MYIQASTFSLFSKEHAGNQNKKKSGCTGKKKIEVMIYKPKAIKICQI